MKKTALLCILLLAVLALCCGCGLFGTGGENKPYDPGTPVPPDHAGIFSSEHGTMNFSGDGEKVTINFDARLAELTGLPEGEQEASYVFLSGDLPPHGSYPVRYDTAHELRITVGEQSVVINLGTVSEDGKTTHTSLNMVTPERIPMVFSEEGRRISVVFEKKSDAK